MVSPWRRLCALPVLSAVIWIAHAAPPGSNAFRLAMRLLLTVPPHAFLGFNESALTSTR